ncbi:uncharacterized protein RJT21DRAFT_138194 [Scheffersomyces amazonensis]|uniref:uncharacterized protein n=1 Tax=Scheffersomyces amazonensis TaxID=1078765 RepID=UPI00315CAEBD
MLTYLLSAQAELTNVTNVGPVDSIGYPFDFKFSIQCNCGKFHDKPVEINRFDKFMVTGFRREANFKFKCKECNRERYVTLDKIKPGVITTSNEWCSILRISTLGLRILEFHPDDQFQCQSSLYDRIIQEIDLSEGEWSGYDDKGEGPIAIKNVEWKVELTK